MRKHLIKKTSSHIFLAILALNISLVFPRTEWMCDCDKFPESISCSCNCPKCVDKRGGLLSYCHLCDFADRDKSKGVIIKKAGCTCGLANIVLHLPGNTPFVTAQHIDISPLFPVSLFKTGTPILALDDFVTLPDDPG